MSCGFLERFKKYYSRSVRAVFLGFGFVSAQLQAAKGTRLRQSLAKTQKSSLRTATLFLEALWCFHGWFSATAGESFGWGGAIVEAKEDGNADTCL
jgi:hypothetical protein